MPTVDLARVFDEIRPLIRRIVEEVLQDYALLDGSRPFTGAPSSNVPHAVGSTQLVRAIEFEAFTNIALLIIAGKQNADATLTALAGLSTVADRMIYATASDVFATTPLTSFARSILDDTSASQVRATISAANVSHGHVGSEVELDDSSWSGVLSGSGIRHVQDLADWLDANLSP